MVLRCDGCISVQVFQFLRGHKICVYRQIKLKIDNFTNVYYTWNVQYTWQLKNGEAVVTQTTWVSATVAKFAYYKRHFSFFVNLREKIHGRGFAFFWAYLKKYGCLLEKSDKQLCFFIYVRRILQCIDWHSVCLQSIANQCNNISAVA